MTLRQPFRAERNTSVALKHLLFIRTTTGPSMRSSVNAVTAVQPAWDSRRTICTERWIPPEMREEIFGLFRRAVGREVEGSGAGLAIVRAVAKRHGGHAWVQPRDGGGSEFIITFGTRKRQEELYAEKFAGKNRKD